MLFTYPRVLPAYFYASDLEKAFFRLQFAKIIHFLYISLVVDFTWLFYTEIMIRIKSNTKSNIKRKGMDMRKRRIAVP